MNKEELIRLAHEASLCDDEGMDDDSILIIPHLERFAALVAAAAVRETSAEYRLGWNDGQINEREACAQLCENLLKPYCDGYGNDGEAYAEEIRARK